jgi:serine/threonine protein kinase
VAFADTAETVGLKEEPQKRYILGELLGSGTAAHVHVGTDTATGLQHAVKILPKRKGTKDKTKLIKAEVRESSQVTSEAVRGHTYSVVAAAAIVKAS